MPLATRISVANQTFDKIKTLAAEQGYDLTALQQWYQHTATEFERYPVQHFVFAQGVETYYRDLRQSGFPKPGGAWQIFLSKDAMVSALVGLPFALILLVFIAGILIAVFSKTLAFKWRVMEGSGYRFIANHFR